MTGDGMGDHSKHMTRDRMGDHSKHMTRDRMGDHSKYTTMGDMSDHSEQMAMPENSISMMGGNGPHGITHMGGMLTVRKVREHLTSYADPGWYQAPRGTVAPTASKQDLEREGLEALIDEQDDAKTQIADRGTLQ
jgi:hypothetical protein